MTAAPPGVGPDTDLDDVSSLTIRELIRELARIEEERRLSEVDCDPPPPLEQAIVVELRRRGGRWGGSSAA